MTEAEREIVDNYKKQYELGLQYQDFATDIMRVAGMSFTGYASKKYQFEKGENMIGWEMKLDNKTKDTGNLYMEISEKTNKGLGPGSVDSGIYREDNSWLYLIGDRTTLYIFAKRQLRMAYEKGYYSPRTTKTATGEGFLLPTEKTKTEQGVPKRLFAENIALKIIDCRKYNQGENQ